MSPRNDEQNAMIKDERREQILSAALKIFATRGFAASKISDIVALGGMSHGLAYHYFASKEEMFYALVRKAVEVSSQSLLTVEAAPVCPLEKVRQAAKHILRGIDAGEETSYYFLIMVHAAVMEGTAEEKMRYLAGSEVPVQAMQRILREGQDTGEIREGDVLEMSIAFFAAIQGIAIYKIAMPDFRMPDYEILVNMVKKQPGGERT